MKLMPIETIYFLRDQNKTFRDASPGHDLFKENFEKGGIAQFLEETGGK